MSEGAQPYPIHPMIRAGHPYLGQRRTKAKKAMTRTMMITRQLQYGPQPSMRLCHLSLNCLSSFMIIQVIK